MARTIDYLTFMVDVTPYEHEGHNYDALNIIVAYRKGQGFVVSWQPVLRTSMGYQTGPLPSRDILVSGAGFVVKEASRNNVKVLEQMRTNLEVAKEGVKFYFDQRDFAALKTFMGDVANYGYTADLENKINELINNSKSSTVMTTNNKTNESANVQNAQVSNPESPMMKQFKQLKEKHPNALLLFRCGDFYECFREDAKAVSEVCGTTLTFRDFGEHVDFTMFPHQGLDKYLPMLIRAGKRVAICDQLESEVKSEESATAEPAKEDKAVTVPLGQHGTLVIGKPGFEPKEDKPKVTLKKETPQPKSEEPVKVDEIVEVNSQPSTLNSQLTYSTYKTKKGNTAPQIIGFGGPDDPRWQSHKDKAHKWCSASFRRDINGEKVYVLIFGTRYMDVAKALAGAYNTDDREAWKRAEDACMAIYEQALRDGKARWEAKKAEWKQKAQERKDKKEADRKCYTKEDVASMLNDLLAGKDIPEDVKKLMKAA